MQTDRNNTDGRIRAELAELFPKILGLAPYMAWRAYNPKADGEEALQTGIIRMLAMCDELKQEFLERTPSGKVAYLLFLIKRNAQQANQQAWRYSVEILPEKDSDTTAPDPAEELGQQQRIAMLKDLAEQIMTEKQHKVFRLWFEDVSHEGIAEMLGVSQEVSRQRLYDGLTRLRQAARQRMF